MQNNSKSHGLSKDKPGISLVVQWILPLYRYICLPVFDPWSGKTPHAAEQLSPCTTTSEAPLPRTCAHVQQRKPLSDKPVRHS